MVVVLRAADIQVDEYPAHSPIHLKNVAAKGLPLALNIDALPIDAQVGPLWFSCLLSGMTDRLFAFVKRLYSTHDPRQLQAQRNGSRMQACLAHIDALLLSQELALRDILNHPAHGVFNTAKVHSIAQRVASSALEASNLVLRTLRELYHDEIDPVARQVQAITADYYLADLGMRPALFPDSLAAKEQING
ncbi:MAG TPA: hypothetical protein VGC62_12325 [Pseudomonas sp.]|uniref:hypothetical protein n=1 Tax=Pseudomonas sp. TaxID=306 RepID=UPI002ED915C7